MREALGKILTLVSGCQTVAFVSSPTSWVALAPVLSCGPS